MIIKATYFVYKDVDEKDFPPKVEKEFEGVSGFFDTDAECFGYLCQMAFEEREPGQDVEKIEVICY